MDDWEKFNEAILLEKEKLHSNLTTEDITEVNYNHEKKVCKYF